MSPALTRPIAGFVAGTIATLLFHQGMYWIAKSAGLPLQGTPWNYAANPAAFGLPSLLNLMFWGGLWGIVYAYLADRLPGPGVVKGLIFGCIFPMLIGSWLVVAMIKGQPILSGALANKDAMRLLPGFLLNGVAFGIGLGVLYPMMAQMLGQRSSMARS
jgi:hypothetical protein